MPFRGAKAETILFVGITIMREIVPSILWLGNAQDATMENVMANEISAVVDLAMEELSPNLPRGTLYYRFPIVDGEQLRSHVLRLAIESLSSLLENEIPTLIFCSAGMSRSPSVAAAALSLVDQGKLEDHLQKVVEGHPHDISPTLWNDIKIALGEINNS